MRGACLLAMCSTRWSRGTAGPLPPAASLFRGPRPPQQLANSVLLSCRRLLADAKKAKRAKKEQLVKIMEQVGGKLWAEHGADDGVVLAALQAACAGGCWRQHFFPLP